ncbi:hypothetical protein ANN_21023 [Periplaneta americana]|uniref:Uncharacterized protein n=1 Tax=Periplaneta americana TaxID=6978 RepID=A0ABQ8SE90_PERAM|nr:hypothetical protein ANN_21023 [Periplaneta americana]
MADQRLVKDIHKWKPLGTRAAGRPKSRWEDDIVNDLRKLRITDWMMVVQNRSFLRILVKPEIKFGTCSLFRRETGTTDKNLQNEIYATCKLDTRLLTNYFRPPTYTVGHARQGSKERLESGRQHSLTWVTGKQCIAICSVVQKGDRGSIPASSQGSTLVQYLIRGQRLSVAKRAEQQVNTKRFNIPKLKDETKQHYQIEISNSFAALGSSDKVKEELDVNSVWENIRDNIKVAAEQRLGYYGSKKKKPWFHEDCSMVVERRK